MTRTRAPLRRLLAASVTGLASALLAAACATPPDRETGGAWLVHEGYGMRADLEGWQVYTEAASAPAGLRGLFANKQSADDPPWFLALRGQEVLSVGVQRTDVEVDRREFLRLMGEQIGGARISNPRELPGGDLIFEIHTPARGASSHYLLHADGDLWMHLTLARGGGLPALEDFGAELARLQVRRDGRWEPLLRPPVDLGGVPVSGWEASAASGGAPGFEPVQCPEGAHPLLWRADTGAGQLHLFGSIHFGHASFYPLAPPIEEAFAEAERLVVEMDLSARQEEIAAAVVESEQGADLRPLSEELSPELHARLSEAVAEHGFPVEVLDGLSPGMVGAFVTAMAFRSRGFDPGAGVDLYFLERAGDREVVELESAAEQMGLIEGFDEAFVEQALVSLERMDTQVDALHRAWRCGDEPALVAVLGDEEAEAAATPEERARLEGWRETAIYARNAQMADRIAAFFELEGDTFVVVGAAHLVGERGIPALLRESGFAVERVGR